jgi:hypothetical protein
MQHVGTKECAACCMHACPGHGHGHSVSMSMDANINTLPVTMYVRTYLRTNSSITSLTTKPRDTDPSHTYINNKRQIIANTYREIPIAVNNHVDRAYVEIKHPRVVHRCGYWPPTTTSLAPSQNSISYFVRRLLLHSTSLGMTDM